MRHILHPAAVLVFVLLAYGLVTHLDEKAERELHRRQDTAAWEEQRKQREVRRVFCRKHQNICAPAEYEPLR